MLGQKLVYHLKWGTLSFIGKILWPIVIKSELLFIRFKDIGKPFSDTQITEEKLTAVIKTFERPKTLIRLVRSIKRFYPNIHIIVVDDSREPSRLDGVQTIVMPYNSGISAGRNRALLEINTEYVLFLDDDFIFYHQTNFKTAIELMDKNDVIDIMGGEVINLPLFKVNTFINKKLYPTDAISTMPIGSMIDGLPVYDKVPNFFIARPKPVACNA